MDVKGEKELLQTAVVWVLQLPHFHFQQHACLMNAIHFQINYEWQVFEPIKRAPYFICSKFNSRLCFTSAVWHVYCCWKMKAPGVKRQASAVLLGTSKMKIWQTGGWAREMKCQIKFYPKGVRCTVMPSDSQYQLNKWLWFNKLARKMVCDP